MFSLGDRSFMSKDSIKIELKPGEGAVVFSEEGIRLVSPISADDMPFEVRETMEFVTFALLKTEWIMEWYDEIATAEAIMDLMGEKSSEPPKLRLIKGGLDEEKTKTKDKDKS